jgi:H+/gluconate symporter-like permease
MTDETPAPQQIEIAEVIDGHQFGIMVVIAIIVASILVIVSMSLYYSSGTAQLDLSRPGYIDVRDQIDNSDDLQNYPSSGAITTSVLAEFKLLFDQKVSKIESVDTFGGDPLNPDGLGLTLVTATPIIIE